MATRPPRVTSTRRQPVTRGGPNVTSRVRQPTTGAGRVVRAPRPFAPSWGSTTAHQAPATGPAAAPAASPAAPAGPAYSLANLPPDASYDQAVGLLQRQRDEGLASIAGERTRGLSDYGFQEGPGGTLAFDPNNPFSKAALLKKTFDTNRRASAQSMGAGGQLYSGAFQNQQDLVNRNQLQSEDSMQKALIGFLARNTQQTRDAGTNYEIAAGQAYGDRVGRFSSNPLYDPAASGPDAPVAAAAAARPPAGGYGTQAQRFLAARKRNPRGIWGR